MPLGISRLKKKVKVKGPSARKKAVKEINRKKGFFYARKVNELVRKKPVSEMSSKEKEELEKTLKRANDLLGQGWVSKMPFLKGNKNKNNKK